MNTADRRQPIERTPTEPRQFSAYAVACAEPALPCFDATVR
ncbi:hypothetical protein [Actinophytocola xanthii]|nr:hypothetical protein [Actinophytocola xanthii]